MPKQLRQNLLGEKGIALAKQTIDTYKQRHNDSIPRKVSYTLWSSEFIETGGATIAQVLYMLGVEPVRDAFGRVSDLKTDSFSRTGTSTYRRSGPDFRTTP